MRKRSEVKKKSSKPSAEERTAPMQYTDPNARVTCPICEHPSMVKDCTTNDKGAIECPACGAPITTEAVGETDEQRVTRMRDLHTEKTKKAGTGPLGPTRKEAAAQDEEQEDIPFPESKTLTSRKPVFETKREAAKQEYMLKDYVSGAPAHEAPPKTYCGKCGAEWSMVKDQPWPNCGHNESSAVDDPNKAERFNPPAGTSRATVLGRTLHVTRGKHNFGYPGISFGGFAIGPYDVLVELGPGVNIVEAARAIRADLKKIADEAFDEELKWYEQKLAQLAKAAEAEDA